MPRRNFLSSSTMVMGYSKAGDMDLAGALFDKMSVKTSVPSTIIIFEYAEKGFASEAIALYDRDGVESCLLVAGVEVHGLIERLKFRGSIGVCNALANTDAQCGSLNKASSVFNRMSKRDVVSWNGMLHAFSLHGHGREALRVFKAMEKGRISARSTYFVAVSCACSHAGFIDNGIRCFYRRKRITWSFLKSSLLVVPMPFEPNANVWGTL
ncbi:Detected protein of unknown function [Hibiscus syriacus]|uniref:Pentatricopeptide repeat-containing protein n=1 Tax=Hibiscus syriacus TaxID=106335 RepID=A0A6A3BMN9_HIBSY|nr:Detected protein of unknown function [Hibiscus syriacus]